MWKFVLCGVLGRFEECAIASCFLQYEASDGHGEPQKRNASNCRGSPSGQRHMLGLRSMNLTETNIGAEPS
jgi:hypothetical protein